MGLFGPKKVRCPANRWTTIISNRFVQMPAAFDVRMTAVGGGDVDGVFEEKRSRWIFRGAPVRGSLAPHMTFERGIWNTFYSVQVYPSADSVAEVD